jgi:ABC-type branched-subunit amino acid transport system ATPase component/ABC-type branched-subunit amino acid transport system permease subunit
MSIGAWEISTQVVAIGALTGLAYAVLAAGLVLIYRATKVINFAHGEIGAFGAAVLAILVINHDWNFFLALGVVLVIGAAIGAVIELLVVRRLFRAPRLVLLVATIGVAQLLFVSQLLLPGVERAEPYPSPLDRTLDLGGLLLGSPQFMVLALVPATIGGLSVFLSRTPYGIAIRASAENPDRAELAGISTKRISTMVWVLAAVLAVLTAVLVNPLRGTIVGLPAVALGPGLLLRALAAALVGRMTSLPKALAGGIGVGIGEAVLFANAGSPGIVDAFLFVLVLCLVLLQRNEKETGGLPSTAAVRPVPERLRSVWWVRRLTPMVCLAAVAVAALLPLVLSSASQTYALSRMLLFAFIGLSVTVLTGWAGQLSLGQFAFVGLGAFVTVGLTGRGVPFLAAVAYGGVAGVLAALMIGFPALRVRGLFLAVTTLGFAVAARSWLFEQDVFLGSETIAFLPRPEVLGIDLSSQRAYYYLCLLALVAAVFVVVRLRASGIGRTLIATKDNEAAAASFAVSPRVAKLTAFAVAGGLAALGGGLLAGLLVQFDAATFGPEASLQIVAMVVIGGLGSVAGPLLGALYVVGLPALLGASAVITLLTSGIGLLVLLLYVPGGLVGVAYAGRAALLRWAEGRVGDAAPPAPQAVAPLPRQRVTSMVIDPLRGGEESSAPALLAEDIVVRFGGRTALQGVTVRADQGEIVGLIGTNGAGKSTLMNVVSGFTPPVSGRVLLFGQDVTRWPPHERAQLDIGRVFQDARLFGALTVSETVQVALEARERSELLPSLLGLPPSLRAERAKRAEAAEHIAFFGLGRYSGAYLSELSTGTRRIVEMCCLLAQGSRLLLLDEPTAGVAQRETEAFGPLLKRVQRELDATIVLIEHDIPLMMSISDRVYCLSSGQVIAEGLPHEVRDDPAVVAAYLGTDERAIVRSGSRGPTRTEPAPMPVLAELDRRSLMQLAQTQAIAGRSRMCKDELIAALEAR